MAKRKSLSKKTRFEVFKRDNFTCQYCGEKAPNVILEVDHINPVSKGGSNELLNLVTSCFDCNRGKSNRELKDDSIVEKQRLQIEELNIRRQQLEMMLEWRDALKDTENIGKQKAITYFNNLFDNYELNNSGELKISKYVDKYGVIKVLDVIDTCYNKYYYDKNTIEENFDLIYSKIGGFLNLLNKPQYKKDIAYIKGICKNKFGYVNEKYYYQMMTEAHNNNIDLSDIISNLKDDYWGTWSQFDYAITYFNNEANQEGDK